MIHYRIVEINEAERQFIVRYSTDTITEDILKTFVDDDGNIVRCRTDCAITIYDANATANDIEHLIKQNAPVSWLNLMEEQRQQAPCPAMKHVYTLKSCGLQTVKVE